MARGSVSQNYSSFNPLILEEEKRLLKATRIISILKKEFDPIAKNVKVLDVGCSSGVITNELANEFSYVVGIDNDLSAIQMAQTKFDRKNLKFEKMSAIYTKYESNYFDLIVANQVYYCFKKPEDFFREMYRIMKPGGKMFLGARNKYTVWDAQYHLPLLAFMPKRLASLVVKKFGNSQKFDAQYRSYWELKRLTDMFLFKTYSPVIIRGYHKLLESIPEVVFKFLEPLYPNFIWILTKPKVS